MPTQLVDLDVTEIAFCAAGKDPAARHVLWKAADPIDKIHGEDDPPSFDEVQARRQLEQAAQVLERRIQDLSGVVWRIVFSGVEDSESRIRESVEQFTASIEQDLPKILAGRAEEDEMAKSITLPESVAKALKELPEEIRKGIDAKVEKAVSDLGNDVVEALGKSDHDQHELAKRVVSGLVTSIVDATKAEAALAKAEEDAKKDDTPADPLQKADLPPEVKAEVERLRKADEQKGEVIKGLIERERTREMTAKAESYSHLAIETPKLVELLRKADEAGLLAELGEILGTLDAQLEKAGLTNETGSSQRSDASDPIEKIEKKAAELRKADPKLSEAQAFTKALESDPKLYAEYLDEQRQAARA